MNSVNIFGKSWLDLVFEGKNKSYGAYQLRRENSRTTLLALLFALLLLTAAASIPVLYNYFTGEKPDITVPGIIDTVITVSTYNPEQPKPKTAVLPAVKKPVTDVKEKAQLVDPEVVKPSEANQNIATNKDNTPVAQNTNTGTAITGENPTPGKTVTTGTATEVPAIPAGPVMTTSLDKLPEFPGGIEKFYNYVGRNFEKPEIDGINAAESIRVFVTFVIEKDGGMTDIRVIRDPGYGVGNEAIRVLKSLKTKWKPGMIGGQPVRTVYSLPITVKTE